MLAVPSALLRASVPVPGGLKQLLDDRDVSLDLFLHCRIANPFWNLARLLRGEIDMRTASRISSRAFA